MLQQEGHAIGAANPLQRVDESARAEAERGRDDGRRGNDAGRDDLGIGLQAAGAHLVGKAGAGRDVPDDGRLGHERPATGRPFQATFAGQLVERASHGDQAAPVAGRELAFRRQAVTGPPLARGKRLAQVEVDLVVERNRPGFESKACHRVPAKSGHDDDPLIML